MQVLVGVVDFSNWIQDFGALGLRECACVCLLDFATFVLFATWTVGLQGFGFFDYSDFWIRGFRNSGTFELGY